MVRTLRRIGTGHPAAGSPPAPRRAALLLGTAMAMAVQATAMAATAQAVPAAPQTTANPPKSTAASPDSGKVDQIVVTASKRSERLQRVAVAVTVVGGAQLTRQNITSVDDLSRAAPAVTATSGPAGAISIRGIGTESFARTSESSVGLVVDNVAIANATSAQAPAALYDIARVEVLEGPQGTLFGRNASAGLLNVATNAPVLGVYSASAHVDIGARDSQIVQTAVNIPLSGTAALRIADHFTRDPETIYSETRGEWDRDDDEGARARLLWQVNDDLTLNFSTDYDETHNRNDTFAPSNATPGGFLANELAKCGIVASVNNNRICLDGPVYAVFQTYGVSGQADYLIGDYTLTSITAGRWFIAGPSGLDSDSIPLNYLDTNYNREHLNNVSQEMRLTSPAADRLSYVVGLYYFNSAQSYDGGQDGTLGVPILQALHGQAGQQFSTNANSQSGAAFGQSTLHITDKARLIFGGRMDREDVQATTIRNLYPGALAPFTTIAPIHGHDIDYDFSYRVGGQYDVAHGVMAYATYTRGYKGPAVNDQSTAIAAPVIVRPETPHDIDLGLKTSVLQDRLALNLALFHNKIDNFQTTIFDPTTVGYVFGNAPSLTTQGVEISAFGRPLPGLTLNAGANYTDARYGAGYLVPCGPTQTTAQGCVTSTVHGVTSSSTDVVGRQLIGAPLWKLTFSGEYDRPLNDRYEGYFQMDGVLTSRIYYNAAPDPLDSTGTHFLLGGRLGLRTRDGRYGIAVYARNLTNDHEPTFVIDTPLASQLGDLNSHSQYFGPDSFRTIGVSMDVKF